MNRDLFKVAIFFPKLASLRRQMKGRNTIVQKKEKYEKIVIKKENTTNPNVK